MNKIENIVKKYIIHHGMFKWQTPYIVALSGGADSVALLLILKNIGLNITAAHCNFHLRGEERRAILCKSVQTTGNQFVSNPF